MNYRPRLTSIRDITRELPARRNENGEIETDLDACRELLFAVLETAMRDHEFLAHAGKQSWLSAAQKRRVRAICEDNDPREFFESDWYADICYFLGLDPEALKDLLHSRSPTTSLAQAS